MLDANGAMALVVVIVVVIVVVVAVVVVDVVAVVVVVVVGVVEVVEVVEGVVFLHVHARDPSTTIGVGPPFTHGRVVVSTLHSLQSAPPHPFLHVHAQLLISDSVSPPNTKLPTKFPASNTLPPGVPPFLQN